MAKWLADLAAPNTANLSENTWQGARGSFITEPLGPRAFYSSLGEARMGVYRLVRERPEHTRFERARTARLGRPGQAYPDERSESYANKDGEAPADLHQSDAVATPPLNFGSVQLPHT